jgi:hypothetical protein
MERCGRRRDGRGERRGGGGGFVFFFFMYGLHHSQMLPSPHCLLSFSSSLRRHTLLIFQTTINVMLLLLPLGLLAFGKVRNSLLGDELVEALMACM